jgi:hypothetical protein
MITTANKYDALITLYQSVNVPCKMLTKDELFATHMSDKDTVTSYLMRITKLQNQCVAIKMKIKNKELVPIALNGFSSSWEPFVQGVCAHEKLPNFEKLWDDFIQEELG